MYFEFYEIVSFTGTETLWKDASLVLEHPENS